MIAEDGQRYGPADVLTLRGWIAEGRMTGGHYLEEETSGRRVMAAEVPQLGFGTMPPVEVTPTVAYPRPPDPSEMTQRKVQNAVTGAWIMG
ncbi:MAG: hypothetical protein EOP06_10220, partial [Proteobacteria bacterium]